MNNIFKDKRAEFFIISAVIIASILMSVQGLFSGYSKVDFMEPIKSRETYTFRNIREQIKKTNASNCDNLRRKLVEFRKMAEESVKERGYGFDMNLSTCTSGNISVDMNLISSDYNIKDNFTATP